MRAYSNGSRQPRPTIILFVWVCTMMQLWPFSTMCPCIGLRQISKSSHRYGVDTVVCPNHPRDIYGAPNRTAGRGLLAFLKQIRWHMMKPKLINVASAHASGRSHGQESAPHRQQPRYSVICITFAPTNHSRTKPQVILVQYSINQCIARGSF